jgi:hypothetical protein
VDIEVHPFYPAQLPISTLLILQKENLQDAGKPSRVIISGSFPVVIIFPGKGKYFRIDRNNIPVREYYTYNIVYNK